jgi:hypothetical protein
MLFVKCYVAAPASTPGRHFYVTPAPSCGSNVSFLSSGAETVSLVREDIVFWKTQCCIDSLPMRNLKYKKCLYLARNRTIISTLHTQSVPNFSSVG